ncbi:MAG: hypothetical protein ACOCNL_15210 [Acetivibrio ethanolgignens]
MTTAAERKIIRERRKHRRAILDKLCGITWNCLKGVSIMLAVAVFEIALVGVVEQNPGRVLTMLEMLAGFFLALVLCKKAFHKE